MADAGIIRLRGVRQNNLKNIDLDLPLNRLTVVTGLSGSGKSSLAFDTLYAEGQRRYIETFSPYARQFFDRMDKPKADSIQGIPPAIALEQKNSVKTTRSTVGTMTEITDHMKVLWGHLSQLDCRGCGRVVVREPPQHVWEFCHAAHPGEESLVTFKLALSAKVGWEETLALLRKQGFQRILARDPSGTPTPTRLEEAEPPAEGAGWIEMVQDRVALRAGQRSRFVEACEQAYHFGKGSLSVWRMEGWVERRFSRGLHCAACDISHGDPTPALFSFNSPVGACPACKGFGRVITMDPTRAIPNRSLSIADGVVKPWQTGTGMESQRDLLKFCAQRRVPVKTPFDKLDPKWQRWIIEGDEGYGKDKAHEWPNAWYGIRGYLRWMESKSYKMHMRVQLAKFRSYVPCPQCGGLRFKPEALAHRAGSGELGRLNLAEFYRLPARGALKFLEEVAAPYAARKRADPVRVALEEVVARLRYLVEVGLGYLTLDRPTRSLSGGETERVNLTTCLGSRLVNTLFILDEPSVGLHASDTERLVALLKRLRDQGNTIVVVEHEPLVMRAADLIVDMGPGQGERGGEIVALGAIRDIEASKTSLTGEHLSGAKEAALPRNRPVDLARDPVIRVSNATLHNLRGVEAAIPLNRLVCVSGVSGSGKSTLVRHLLTPALEARLAGREADPGEIEGGEPAEGAQGSCDLAGWEGLGSLLVVDQASPGRTPRSTPAVYTGAFEHVRDLFAASPEARRRGLKSSAFSFNSRLGQCERCRGAGFEKIEMQFLSDIFIRCPECGGRRYRPHILEVKIAPPDRDGHLGWSIADALEASVLEAVEFLGHFKGSRPAARAAAALEKLVEVGLGYLRLGQPVTTLSGGECQRLKLAGHLAEFAARRAGDLKPSLFLFDEPTTGLHFHDVAILLAALQKLVDSGHSVLVVEHNLDVIRSADWVIDMGPGGGEEGGWIVHQGPVETLLKCPQSVTGRCLGESVAAPRRARSALPHSVSGV